MRSTVREKKVECTGCGACSSICPRQAIQMIRDEEGFLYPVVRQDLCISCDRCEERCPAGKLNSFQDVKPYGAQNRDISVRKASSSGGVFSALCDWMFGQDGVVYGAIMNEDHTVEHVGVLTEDGVAAMRGSKYVQSDSTEAIRTAIEILAKGIPVLFSGTPCEIAGLYAALDEKRPEHLLTIDFVCHGVPSPTVYESYVKGLEKSYGSEVISYGFRDKRLGWKNFSAVAQFKNGAEYTGTQSEDPFLLGFLNNLYLRPSCYNCNNLRYGHHLSDITMADLWGAETICKQKDDDTGLSLVFTNTPRGKRILESLPGLELFAIDNISVLKHVNPSIYAPVEIPASRKAFFKSFRRDGFEKDRIIKLITASRGQRFIKSLRGRCYRALRKMLRNQD